MHRAIPLFVAKHEEIYSHFKYTFNRYKSGLEQSLHLLIPQYQFHPFQSIQAHVFDIKAINWTQNKLTDSLADQSCVGVRSLDCQIAYETRGT